MNPPQHPIGALQPEPVLTAERRAELIAQVESAPALLRQAVLGLSSDQLDCLYKNWTIRQIVHHLADSHVHSYIRFKWTLTEDQPTIKAYEEADWVALNDSRSGDIAAPLALMEGLHGRWVQLMRTMSEAQFGRSFVHPQSGEIITLDTALGYYAWHGRHHTGQIQWLRSQKDW